MTRMLGWTLDDVRIVSKRRAYRWESLFADEDDYAHMRALSGLRALSPKSKAVVYRLLRSKQRP